MSFLSKWLTVQYFTWNIVQVHLFQALRDFVATLLEGKQFLRELQQDVKDLEPGHSIAEQTAHKTTVKKIKVIRRSVDDLASKVNPNCEQSGWAYRKV